MKKQYIAPIVYDNDDLFEGVYMASGSIPLSCYSFSANIVQRPEMGRDWYVIQINGVHNATHHSTERIVGIVFNQNVTYKSSNASKVNGDGTSVLMLTFTDGINGAYHNNGVDNIGLGELCVHSDEGLTILSTNSIYCNEDCDKH